MKKYLICRFLNPQIIIYITVFYLLSCESLDKDPEYVGSWQFNEVITSGDLVFYTNRTLILNRSSYQEIYLVQRDDSESISQITGTRGKLTPARSNFIFSLEELGTCVKDDLGACTENIQWYGEGSQYWNDNILYFKKTVTGFFEIRGTTLRLTRDLNHDQDFEDSGEDVTFEQI
jgi:hypothetical protein